MTQVESGCLTFHAEPGISLARKKHPRYFFPDGNVIFRVENTLYRVHRYFFRRDSSVFDGMFSLPSPVGERPEGEVEDNPIHLEGIEAREFDRLLSILYPIDFVEHEIKTTEEWISVLNLASCWEFLSLRDLAIKKLTNLASSVDKVVLGQRFDIEDWLVPAFTDLCIRNDPLNVEEGRKLGVDTTIAIGQVRHQIRYFSNLNRHHDNIVELVRGYFIPTLKST